MSDQVTASPSPTPSAPVATPSSSEKPVIAIPNGGSIDRRALAKFSGHDTLKPSDAEEYLDADDDTFGFSKTPEEDRVEDDGKEEGEDVPGDPEEKDSDEQGEDESSDTPIEDVVVKGKGIKLRTADGKEFKLPKDAVIVHKVDGELKEINLADAIDREVGELTVEQRLSKLANVETQYKQKIETLERTSSERETFLQEISKLSTSEEPEKALAALGEMTGIPPGQIYKQFVEQGMKWARFFSEKGISEAQLEAHWAKLDRDFYSSKYQKEKEAREKARDADAFTRTADQVRLDNGVTEQEFIQAVGVLEKEDAYAGVGDRRAIEITVAKALELKHENLVNAALKSIDYKDKKKLSQVMMDATNPHDFTIDELKQLALEYIKSEAPSLSQKQSLNGRTPAQNVGAKANKKKDAVRSVSDLKRVFGVKR